MEIPEAARAVAAGPTVAASFDGDVRGLPDEIVEWLEYHPDAGTLADARLAIDALERVASVDSELREVWLEAANGPAWVEEIARLAYRLTCIVGDSL